jgi:hypothetical protein
MKRGQMWWYISQSAFQRINIEDLEGACTFQQLIPEQFSIYLW